MILVSKTYWTGMPFWFRRTPSGARSESLVLRAHDLRQFRAVCWTHDAHPKPRVGVVLAHPRVDFTHHYAIPRLLEAGFCVLGLQTRNGAQDTYVEHEEMVLDVAGAVRWLRERQGIAKVVLFGNSGGGSLLAYYQAEARLPPTERTKESPGRLPTRFDNTPMSPADAMVYVAVHRGQGKILLDCIDASVSDERDPLSVDPTLDIYDERNGFREPPAESRYPASFLDRYREAQAARVERLDATAHAMISRQESAAAESDQPTFSQKTFTQRRDVLRRRFAEPIMTVYRTMANPTYVDLNLDRSARDYGSLLSERPDLMNYSALGLARTVTPRAWLSTWSGLSSRADLVENVARIREPSLLVTPTRDREVLPSDTHAIYAAMASPDKRAVSLDARHYFEPPPGETSGGDADRMLDVVIPWIHEHT
ncbi:MAG: hypothetical protein KIT84_44720 [Labilithrix sp.]|nr:hypothetical protein [Labilithrix sp.]MCW5818185.1 hypothetical protein [Labilithrix sp.]